MTAQNNIHEDIAEILASLKENDDRSRIIEIEEKKIQLMVVLLEDRHYAFYGKDMKEIVAVGDISYVPGMPEYLLGVINVRGDIESVLDLRMLLQLPHRPPDRQSKIVIGKIHGIRSGLLVDSVEDVLEIPEDQISQPGSFPSVAWADYIEGEASYKGCELIILNLGKIFDTLLD